MEGRLAVAGARRKHRGACEMEALFFGGKTKCVTFSYDDGVTQDRRLVELFNKYGVRATFNLNSGCFGRTGMVSDPSFIREATHNKIEAGEVAKLYAGHEIAVHTVSHPNLVFLDREAIRYEIGQDRKNLEKLVDYPVTGMAYPYGPYDDTVLEVMRECGISYSRTVQSTNSFAIPRDFLMWHPSCHFGDEVMTELIGRFLSDNDERQPYQTRQLFYIWGHSYELDGNETWNKMEETLKMLSGREDTWYATNGEICEYENAVRRLIYNAQHTTVKNPSALPVWLDVNGEPVEIKPGEIKHLL